MKVWICSAKCVERLCHFFRVLISQIQDRITLSKRNLAWALLYLSP